MAERILLRLPPGDEPGTTILVGDDALDCIPGDSVGDRATEEAGPWLDGRTAFFLSSAKIRSLQGQRLTALRSRAGTPVDLEVIDGEAAKRIEHAEPLWEEMLSSGGKRDSRLVTFGGGSVGDLGGFVAGAFLRGIEYAQVPTTLLAQVDAALGGKTAVDLAGGKNTVGLFHHPRFVISDTRVLATLPKGELRSGLVEVVKMGALLDFELFERVESDLDRLLDAEAPTLAPVVAAAARAKCAVVEEDPKEKGRRRVLNFGHTLAHALEKVLRYDHLRHGEAVGYGLLFALRLSRRLGLLDDDGKEALDRRMARLLRRFELPSLRDLRPELGDDPVAALGEAMSRDKKATEEGIFWSLARGPEREALDVRIPLPDVRRELAAFLDDPWGSDIL